ncbi:GntR family transcriptional regulator [Albidovulum sp.]|uniref:GntR family transcriptional regulator n=1 Tax=Albidovulum sp. TaxID=1872424 RepID=UPI002D0F6E25|nr:GntR family transcriptional regulator [Paracoccaceae bacterium]MCP5376832.1 GntR family transcriptional regulator [Paracoccaceae bacterium]HPE25281.1 GntR family transcriptional regulator [Albidovulum sp.]HRV64388.1 GntR family transcriptional regulator [Albidovulum sp.]
MTDAATASARDRFDRMHAILRNRICLLDYAPGTRLSEEALAAEFGVSRTPLRRVLSRLEGEGLLQSVHGVGTFVTDVEVEELAQTYRLRLELAELTGRLDPVAPDAALWADLRALLDRARGFGADPDPRAYAELIMDVFLALLRLTANEPLREICERLYFRTTRIWLKSVFAGRLDLASEVDVFRREVEDIVMALQVGDLHSAALIQRAHISMSFERMRRGLSG